MCRVRVVCLYCRFTLSPVNLNPTYGIMGAHWGPQIRCYPEDGTHRYFSKIAPSLQLIRVSGPLGTPSTLYASWQKEFTKGTSHILRILYCVKRPKIPTNNYDGYFTLTSYQPLKLLLKKWHILIKCYYDKI